MIRYMALLTLALFALAGCDQRIDNARLRVDVIEDAPRTPSVGQLPLTAAAAELRNSTAQGLVGFDPLGRVLPALASRWIVTDDDLSYIFRLQKTRWNNGREITSEEVATALRARISLLRAGPMADELAMIDDVVSMTGKVIEIRLKAPMPNLLEILAQPEFGIVHKGAGSGPMQADRLGRAMSMKLRVDEADGSISLDSHTVTLRAATASTALARYATGHSDLVTNGRFEHAPLVTANTQISATLELDPTPGLFGFLFVDAGPFLSSAANREAITSAIDRPRMLSGFAVGTWREMLTLSPEGLRNRGDIARPAWTSDNMQVRKATAKAAIATWQSAHGAVRPLKIALPSGPGARILFAYLQVDLANIGLQAVRVGPTDPADLRFIDVVADTTSPSWYLSRLSCNATSICSHNADRLVAEGRMARDPEQRKAALAQAETELQSLRNFIPIANPLRWSIAREGLLGFTTNPRGAHPLQYLGRDPT